MTPEEIQALLGTRWQHKKKNGIYRVTEIKDGDTVYLTAETRGSRSTWKYAPLLPWDYDKLP
jgi:hypothetical protein